MSRIYVYESKLYHLLALFTVLENYFRYSLLSDANVRNTTRIRFFLFLSSLLLSRRT